MSQSPPSPFNTPVDPEDEDATEVINYRIKPYQAAKSALEELTAEASAAGLYDTSPSDYEQALRTARTGRGDEEARD